MEDFEKKFGWKDHRVIVCSRWLRLAMPDNSAVSICELCHEEIIAWRVSIEEKRARKDIHLICKECFARAKKTDVKFGGRVRNNKIEEV